MMGRSKVLMVDDDVEFSGMVAKYLGEDGFDVHTVSNGEQALRVVNSEIFDAMILDVMMPGMSGHEVLRRLQTNPAATAPMPLLMLTARGDEVDRIVGLEAGADDYLPKPCSLRELSARLRAILRRSPRADRARAMDGPTELKIAGVSLDIPRRKAAADDRGITLTGAEFEILKLLMERAGTPVDKSLLMKQALGRDYEPYDRSIDFHVANLRKKLKPRESAESLIQTIRGIGYQFVSS